MTTHTPPSALADDLRRLTEAELSRPARIGYLGLLLTASTMTAIVTALLLTEPSLPLRATVALAAGVVIGLSWVVFAAWVLTRRRPLLGHHRIVAGRMAVTFTATFLAGSLSLGYFTSNRGALAAAALASLMLAAALLMLIRAKRDLQRLKQRRDELQHQLGRRR